MEPEGKPVQPQVQEEKIYATPSDLFTPIAIVERKLKNGKWIKVKRLPLRKLGEISLKAGENYTLLSVLTLLESIVEPKMDITQIDQMTQDQFSEILKIVAEVQGRTAEAEEKTEGF